MFSSENKVQKTVRIIIETLTVIIGAAAVILAVMTFINTRANSYLFPIIFILGAAMNILSGVKSAMTDNKGAAVTRFIIGALLLAVAYVTHVSVGGQP